MGIDKLNSIPYYGKGTLNKLVENNSDKYPNGYFKSKKCRFCLKEFQPLAPSHHYCNDVCINLAKADSYYYRNYKISIFQYYDLYTKNNGKCYICKTEGFTINCKNPTTTLIIDHDHETGEVRGLLCPNCNRALGLFKDSIEFLENAKKYLLTKCNLAPDNRTTRLFRNRKVKPSLDKQQLFNLYTDRFSNKLRTLELAKKYGVTKETIHHIVSGKTHKKELEEYRHKYVCNDYPERE